MHRATCCTVLYTKVFLFQGHFVKCTALCLCLRRLAILLKSRWLWNISRVSGNYTCWQSLSLCWFSKPFPISFWGITECLWIQSLCLWGTAECGSFSVVPFEEPLNVCEFNFSRKCWRLHTGVVPTQLSLFAQLTPLLNKLRTSSQSRPSCWTLIIQMSSICWESASTLRTTFLWLYCL